MYLSVWGLVFAHFSPSLGVFLRLLVVAPRMLGVEGGMRLSGFNWVDGALLDSVCEMSGWQKQMMRTSGVVIIRENSTFAGESFS